MAPVGRVVGADDVALACAVATRTQVLIVKARQQP